MSDLRTIHRTYNKVFSSLFSVDSPKSDETYREALAILGLDNIINFSSVSDSCRKLLRKVRASNLEKLPDGNYLVDVPGLGDCWVVALLAPLIGFVIDENDELGIVKHFRERLSNEVSADPTKFEDLFENRRRDLDEWVEEIKRPRKWGGSTEFEIFARLTGKNPIQFYL